MNHKPNRPNDAMLESESPETSARLDAFEQRLKATRPQAVQLDACKLQQLAEGRAVDALVELPGDRKSRSLLSIAASWMCGVAVGAMVTFILMSRTVPASTVSDKVVHAEQESPQLITTESGNGPEIETEAELPDDSTAVANAEPRKVDTSRLSTAFDFRNSTTSAYLANSPTLQAGMYLPRPAARFSWPFLRSVDNKTTSPNDYKPSQSKAWTESTSDDEADASFSRRALMQEFLEESVL